MLESVLGIDTKEWISKSEEGLRIGNYAGSKHE